MSTTTVDLWPSDFGDTGVIPPVTIMRQQATLLGQKTQNLVEAQVTSYHMPEGGQSGLPTAESPLVVHRFDLVATAIGGYRFTLFSVRHGVAMYPATIQLDGSPIKCDTQEKFVEQLRQIFNLESTRKVIASLLAQSKE